MSTVLEVYNRVVHCHSSQGRDGRRKRQFVDIKTENRADGTETVQVRLELGHRATLRSRPTQEGFTHDWVVYVRGSQDTHIDRFIDKVEFHLHESFPKSRRVIREPPYQVAETGYGGFTLPIDVYLRNNGEPKKIRFQYELFLGITASVSHNRVEKVSFVCPSPLFRERLIQAGGITPDMAMTVTTSSEESTETPSPGVSMATVQFDRPLLTTTGQGQAVPPQFEVVESRPSSAPPSSPLRPLISEKPSFVGSCDDLDPRPRSAGPILDRPEVAFQVGRLQCRVALSDPHLINPATAVPSTVVTDGLRISLNCDRVKGHETVQGQPQVVDRPERQACAKRGRGRPRKFPAPLRPIREESSVLLSRPDIDGSFGCQSSKPETKRCREQANDDTIRVVYENENLDVCSAAFGDVPAPRLGVAAKVRSIARQAFSDLGPLKNRLEPKAVDPVVKDKIVADLFAGAPKPTELRATIAYPVSAVYERTRFHSGDGKENVPLGAFSLLQHAAPVNKIPPPTETIRDGGVPTVKVTSTTCSRPEAEYTAGVPLPVRTDVGVSKPEVELSDDELDITIEPDFHFRPLSTSTPIKELLAGSDRPVPTRLRARIRFRPPVAQVNDEEETDPDCRISGVTIAKLIGTTAGPRIRPADIVRAYQQRPLPAVACLTAPSSTSTPLPVATVTESASVPSGRDDAALVPAKRARYDALTAVRPAALPVCSEAGSRTGFARTDSAAHFQSSHGCEPGPADSVQVVRGTAFPAPPPPPPKPAGAPEVGRGRGGRKKPEQPEVNGKRLPEVVEAAEAAPSSDSSRRAPNGMPVGELMKLQRKLATLSDVNLLRRVVQIISESGRYCVSEVTFDFDLCNLDPKTVTKLVECLESVK